MKKALGGCLIVVLLALVVGGGAAWWFVLRPAWNASSQFFDAANQLADLAKLETQVKNRSAFAPSGDGRIPDASLGRFLAVQKTLHERLGSRLTTLESKYRQIEAEVKAKGGRPGVTEVLGAYGDLFSLVREAKQTQVDALNAQNLSLAEYRWIRVQAYAALASRSLPSDASADSALAANVQRLAPHRELLTQTAVVAWLGL